MYEKAIDKFGFGLAFQTHDHEGTNYHDRSRSYTINKQADECTFQRFSVHHEITCAEHASEDLAHCHG
jgi:hypothetical protein